jgi:hypothetical protein
MLRDESFGKIIKPISMKKLILSALLLTLGLTAANAQRHDGLGDLPARITTKMMATVARVGHRINRKVYHRHVWTRAHYPVVVHHRNRNFYHRRIWADTYSAMVRSGIDQLVTPSGDRFIIVRPRGYTGIRKEVQ